MCTFAPKLNKRPLSDEWAGSVIERSEAWQARRDQKLHEAREHDADKDLEGCTFRYAKAFPEAGTAVDVVLAALTKAHALLIHQKGAKLEVLHPRWPSTVLTAGVSGYSHSKIVTASTISTCDLCIACCVTCRPDMRASSRSLVGTLEAAAMTRSLPEQEVLKYLSHGLTAVEAEGSIVTHNASRYFALWVGCTVVVHICVPEAVCIRCCAS